MKVLGIDTTADDTCAAVVEDGQKICSNIVFSQAKIHAKYGGIVPEVAAREHIKNVIPTIKVALKEAEIGPLKIDLISVCQSDNPALVWYFVGVNTARALAYATGIPLVGVDHMESHIYANLIEHPQIQFPFVCATVSGGHTMLVLTKDHGKYKILGQTRDDAAGEAFDKVARMLGLSYPGGPVIDKMAAEGNPKAFDLPRPMLGQRNYEFSYSGLKTSVLYKIKDYQKKTNKQKIPEQMVKDLAASFRAAAVEVLIKKAFRAAEEFGVDTVVLGGGVAANSLFRNWAEEEAGKAKIALFYPSLKLCTDNAVGTAVLGYYQHQRKGADNPLTLPVYGEKGLGAR